MTEHLTEQQIENFHVILKSKKEELLGQIEDLNDALLDNKVTSPDPIDAAAGVEERNTIMAQLNQKQSALREVNYALNNFEDFGYCMTCGVEINIKRLEINPATTECIDCKTRAEHLSKINTGK